jgi:hypothetical protein
MPYLFQEFVSFDYSNFLAVFTLRSCHCGHARYITEQTPCARHISMIVFETLARGEFRVIIDGTLRPDYFIGRSRSDVSCCEGRTRTSETAISGAQGIAPGSFIEGGTWQSRRLSARSSERSTYC